MKGKLLLSRAVLWFSFLQKYYLKFSLNGMFFFSDFIVEVKVESEFIDDYSSLVEGMNNNNNNNNNKNNNLQWLV